MLTLFYKCLCNKRYEEWLKTWSTSNIKRQYKKIHSRTQILNCSKNAVKLNKRHTNLKKSKDLNELSSNDSNLEETKEFSSDSDYESCKVIDGTTKPEKFNKHSDLKLTRFDNDTLLNKIINGKKDEIDLMPFKLFNSGIINFFVLY